MINQPLDVDFVKLAEYIPIVVFFSVALLIALVMSILPVFLAQDKPNKAKLTGYECGFDPFSNSRGKFDIRFYLVAILFIIFDLEITFLIPWAVTFKKNGFDAYFSMMIFLFILTIGFIYEWKKGALDWE